ncbi:MAG TPA: ABC transporter permease [Bryobacteraceae bacterium]|nr:ABC transporter permease [Bryobacteraceae bacterium]
MKSQASFFESAAVALDSLRGSKLRSFLTLLGIILSTTTLIAVMALIHGMDTYIAETASSMGNDGFRVLRLAFLPGQFTAKKYLEANRINPNLSPEEYAFLKDNAKFVREFGISAQRGTKVTYSGDLVDGVVLLGFPENGPILTNTQLELGRGYTVIEDQHKANVVILGHDFKDRFFPGTDPIGKFVGIDGLPFEVIGVAKSKGSLFGQSQDNFVNIPVETYFKYYGTNLGIQYNFMALDRDRLEQAEDEIRALLRAFRHLPPQQEDTFAILSSDSLVSAWDSITGTLAAAAVGIVSVFMVVGGVVIMNIMLAVVTERTREIGVRKSVGARRRDILNQFLVESSMLAGMGGLIGVTVAWLLAVAVRNFTAVPMDVPINAVVIGVALSTTVGLFFGIYPARRASRLDPIVALRSEN